MRDRDARQGWVRALRKAAKANPIREFYRLGKQIGKGKFSVVLVGSNLRTGYLMFCALLRALVLRSITVLFDSYCVFCCVCNQGRKWQSKS